LARSEWSVTCGAVVWIRPPQQGEEGPIFIISYPEDHDGYALFVGAVWDADPDSFVMQIREAEHSWLEADCYLDFSTLDFANMRRLAAALTNRKTPNYERVESASDALVQKIQEAALEYELITPVQKKLIKQAMERRC